MTTIEQTHHHIDVDAYPAPAQQFVAHCTDHHTRAMTPGFTRDEAAQRFVCDPDEQRFLVCAEDGTGPRITDLGGLRDSVRGGIEESHYSDIEALQYFRWRAEAPHLQPLTIELVDASHYDDNDYAHPRYAITAEGEHIADVVCRIDGRA
ncbi:hypothetical protein [Mycobacterium hubeiense]|uniref:hypothetical protein n=1 Tax=Mycobacterium hubeiense TaxID=1867256 RepID=UPI000C7F445E|nr:hypothetical protein [Mycobacterium sp. QGD 101]